MAPVAEDTVRLITQAELLVNATDIDSASLTATNLQVSTGTLTDNGDGTWNFIPVANDTTDVSFTYTVTDGISDVAGTATMDINPVNDAPDGLTVTGSLQVPENTETSNIGSVVFTDADADDDHRITVSDSRFEVINGVLALKPGITFDHESENVVPLQITVTDNAGAAAVHEFVISITDVNEAPQTTPVVLTNIEEDSGVRTITQTELLANATDVDGDTLTATGLTIATGNGTLLDNNDGTWSYTPVENDNSDVSFNYEITDNNDNLASVATLDITPVNDAPVTNGDVGEKTGTESFSFPVPDIFFDIDGDELTLSASLADGNPLPPWIEFDSENRIFNVSENNSEFDQTASVLITATDPDDSSTTSNVFDIKIERTEEPAIAAAAPATIPPPAVTPEEVSETEAEEVVVEEEETQDDTDVASTEEIFEAALLADSGEIAFEEQALNEVVQFARASETLTGLNLDNEINLEVKSHNEFRLINNSQDINSTTTRTQQEIAAINSLSLKNLSAQADASQSALKDAEVLSTTVLATSTTLTSSLSVGYILWLLRGGTLLASVMASLPAWRSIDPLPVLEGLTGDSEDDTETLESMVESEDEETEETAK